MSSHNLLSKEWCNLVFEGRNKDYGAYQIRKDIGKRYFVALSAIILSVLVLLGVFLGLHFFMKIKMQQMMDDLTARVPNMKMADVEMGHELTVIAGGRQRQLPRLPQVKDGTTSVPKIVEVTKNEIHFGIDEDPDENMDEAFHQEMEESLNELDSVFEEKLAQLPVEGPHLQPTEVVEQMPQFPGGIRALMKWLDYNIVYPQRCIRMKIGGELQVTFLVEADGTLNHVHINNSLHPDLDQAVLNAIRRMPKWIPGTVDGKPAVVSVTLPVHFQPR